MSSTLEQRLRSLDDGFFVAVRGGATEMSSFCDNLDALRAELRSGLDAGMVSQDVADLATASFASVMALSQRMFDFVRMSDEIADEATSTIDQDSNAQPAAASLPLFRYLLDNICHPYPDLDEKERLAEEAREAGWADFDKRKCEDWLNRKRHQSGYVAIARKYCDEDTEAMSRLCSAALFGSAEQRSQVHPTALEEIESMRELVQAQYDDLAAQELSPWVEDLSQNLQVVIGDLSCGHPTSGSLSSDNDEADYADCSDCSDDESDSDSDVSATDIDSDYDCDDAVKEDVTDVPLPAVIGAKRKLSDLPAFTPPRRHLVPRSPSSSSASSSSSDSIFSVVSFRSTSASSATSWEEDEDECDRPAKRTRSESVNPEPASATSDLRTVVDMWAMRLPSNAVTLSKRKRDDDDLETLARNMKRSRYAALSAAAPSNIPGHHLTSLTDVCTRSWSSVVPFDILGYSVDSELYTVDCTAIQASAATDEEDEDEDNNLADIIDLCNDPDAPDDATWATVQLHALAQTLTGSRLPMAAELCADTVEVKLEELSPQELSSLGETLSTTAEAITAEYPLDQSLLLEDDDAFSPPELSDGESSGTSSPDRSPSPPVELESSPERLMADYAMSQRKELDPLHHPWFAQMFGQQGLSFFDPNAFRVECNPPPGMMAQESHPDFLAQLDL
ncbi:hypothetical protein EXIGLDRAFT_831775 [Exidia glandulosa HHB12029]|uniref:Homeobox KN domain-containing protein n=1 Tax=Exidia glandulosa HHB12029 TaxID=1314781 RepID=A0A166B8X3_EXIGL|nr:hypothetical protein EXIGLDRAFT_831775 [Exidia glandulosa HHB12029]